MAAFTYEETIDVHADREAAWDVLADVESWPTWTGSVRSVSLLDGAPLAVGSTVRIVQPRLPAMTWTVRDFDSGRSFSWDTRGRGVHTMADHKIEATSTGCRVTLVVRQSGPLAGLSRLLFGNLTRRYLHLEATGLKRRAESRRPRPGDVSSPPTPRDR